MTTTADPPDRARRGGTLFLVATPIGNLEDISRRALRVLADVDLILAEDTRRTRKLLSRYDIHTQVRAFHEHNEDAQTPDLVAQIAGGARFALVSDAGTPLISDPGFPLIRAIIEAGLEVVPIPGPSAVLAALAASGLPTARFLFAGYLPRRSAARRAALEGLQDEPGTLIFLESPRRVARTLADAAEILGNRPVAVARELTKVHEEFLRGSLPEISRIVAERSLRGEVTLCVGGAGSRASRSRKSNEAELDMPELQERFSELMENGHERNEALKIIVRETGIPRRKAYQALIVGQEDRPRPELEEES
jgi:16S rRNA (cytidine1402-2'-O)-methyltransferase